jgi:anti-sigma factor RsiW
MRRCEELRELIPWYVEGSVTPQEGAEVAAHLSTCPECLQDLADAARLRMAVRAALTTLPQMPETVWERVSRQVLGRRLGQLDVGSFIVGLRLGAWLTQRGSAVRANLRVMGRDVQLFRVGKGDG